MGRQATKVKSGFFNDVQLDAGLLLSDFSFTSPYIDTSDILFATTGGIQASCVPTTSDLFADVDNAPNDTKEGLHIDGWECTLSTTAVTIDKDATKLSLGFWKNTASNSGVMPTLEKDLSAFKTLWWVGDMANGGLAVIKLSNAVSSGGFSMQTTKNGKGTFAVTIKGYSSITDIDTVPMEFYVIAPPSP